MMAPAMSMVIPGADMMSPITNYPLDASGDTAWWGWPVDEEIERIFLDLPEDDSVEPIAGRGEEVREQLRLLTHAGSAGKVIRTHGDYHLGQTILAGRGWVVLDFEGEPARPLIERRRKRSPLRDVAGMLRSFDYAARTVLRSLPDRGLVQDPEHPTSGPWSRLWTDWVSVEFLAGYLGAVEGHGLLPETEEGRRLLLDLFVLEKALYELGYELGNRPEWARIPLEGILSLMEKRGGRG
jgi:maltokinase